jgi:hypothetical protein
LVVPLPFPQAVLDAPLAITEPAFYLGLHLKYLHPWEKDCLGKLSISWEMPRYFKFFPAQRPSRRGGNACLGASAALGLIGKLYAIERELPPLLPPADDRAAQQQRQQREEQRRQLRQRQAEPVLTELQKWLEEQRPQALPKSALGQAIGYALNHWEALRRYLEAGYLAIDNNLSERTLRAIALGRNNWGVIGSGAGGQTAAVLDTIVGTCKHLGMDPFAYLREVLPALLALGEKPRTEALLEWLPDRWLRRRGRDAPGGTAAWE